MCRSEPKSLTSLRREWINADLNERRLLIVSIPCHDRLGLDVLANYVALNPESQARNIAAWTPVCAEILQGFCSFEDDAVSAMLLQVILFRP